MSRSGLVDSNIARTYLSHRKRRVIRLRLLQESSLLLENFLLAEKRGNNNDQSVYLIEITKEKKLPKVLDVDLANYFLS